jgi:hypothetical protein
VTSPDGRHLQRLSCRACSHDVTVAIWCHDPGCCEQDPARFIASLRAAGTALGTRVYAVRYLNPAAADPAAQVSVWRDGDPGPLFTGTAADAVAFTMRHDCPRPGHRN